MHHTEDQDWNEDQYAETLTATRPKNFKAAMVEHYRHRVQQVIQKGLIYTKQYFFVRNRLREYER